MLQQQQTVGGEATALKKGREAQEALPHFF
jgi:hypothetical protein